MKTLIFAAILLFLTACVHQGSYYFYKEETKDYRVEASAEIFTNSDSVDLEIYVLQGGVVVKHIKFGKTGTDNTPMVKVQAEAVGKFLEEGAEVINGFTSPLSSLL